MGMMAKFAGIVTGAALSVATPAMAVTKIDFTNIKGTWFDIVGGTNVNYDGQGTESATVTWGTGDNQSGYRFDAVAIPQLVVSPSTNTSAVTNIGKFTHFNFPIGAGTSISAVKLKFTTDVLVNDMLFGNVEFIYAFNHWETTNRPSRGPCANGGANNTGVNASGCADRVAVNFNQASGAFSIGDVDYALDVFGFLDGGEPVDFFWTRENKSNEAFIRGQVVLRENAGAVPEPASWAMMIGGFGLIGATARRRNTALKFA